MNGVFTNKVKRKDIVEKAAFSNATNNTQIDLVLSIFSQSEMDDRKHEIEDEPNNFENDEAISSGDDLIEG